MFSVLMTIYKNDDLNYLEEAINSLINQTLVPSEILIVKDGPLKPETEVLLNSKFASNIFNYISLEKNVGQSLALRYGLEKCKYEIVARMDSDDISHPKRFEKQFSEFEKNPELDVVGTGIIEFTHSIEDADKIRDIPQTHDEIVRYSKYRCPINHATVMYKKSKVLEAGSYMDIFSVADYHLWPRMFKLGAKFKNIPEPLLFVRAGRSMYARRGGFKYARQDFKLQLFFLQIKHINLLQFIFNSFVRVASGLSPNFVRCFVYEKILRRKVKV